MDGAGLGGRAVLGFGLTLLAGSSLLPGCGARSRLDGRESPDPTLPEVPEPVPTPPAPEPQSEPFCPAFPDGGPCGELYFEPGVPAGMLEPRPVDVLLVVDGSESMGRVPNGYGTSKWDAVAGAISGLWDTLSESFRVGLLTAREPEALSDCGENCCNRVSAAPAFVVPNSSLSTPSSIEDILIGVNPSGLRTTYDLLQVAFDHFEAAAASTPDHDRLVLLITDGGPQCGAAPCAPESCSSLLEGNCTNGNCCDQTPELCLDDERTLAVVEGLAEIGVHTAVLGLPGSEPYHEFYRQLAATGMSRYYPVSAELGETGLAELLSRMLEPVMEQCELPLDDLGQCGPHVAVNCELLPDHAVRTVESVLPAGGLVFESDLCGSFYRDDSDLWVLYGCARICAPLDAQVETPFGPVAMNDLRPGDLVYSVQERATVVAPLLDVRRTFVSGHEMVQLGLDDGNVVEMSASHPTADGRLFGDLVPGDLLDGRVVIQREVVAYDEQYIVDILPDTDTGDYFVSSVRLGTTLTRRGAHALLGSGTTRYCGAG